LLLILVLVFLVRYLIYLRLHYWDGKSIRVVHSGSQLANATLCPFGPGLEKEAVQEFCRKNNLELKWTRVFSRRKALKMLKTDRAELAVGYRLEKEQSYPEFIRTGPEYLASELLVAHNRYRYAYKSDQDFCRAKLLFLDRMFWQKEVEKIQNGLDCGIKKAAPARDNLDLFSVLDENKARFALCDRLSLRIWHPFFTAVRKSRSLDREAGFGWMWVRRYSDLDRKLSGFAEKYFSSSRFKRRKGRYLNFLPDKVDHYQIFHFLKAIKTRVPKYQEKIIRAALDNNMDPLFFIALIYQESHFDPGAKSRTGVRGLLQITRNTARELGVNRFDPEQSINGGARYMHYLWEQVGKRGVRGWDRWFMSLAAYNQGMSHLWDAMELARMQGKDPMTWQGVKDVYPLLSYKKYYSRVPNGYCRGFEAVDYVQSIRFYYYILRGLFFLGRPEVQDLGRTSGRIPALWP